MLADEALGRHPRILPVEHGLFPVVACGLGDRRLGIDHRAVLHHDIEPAPVLKHGNVGERVAVNHQEVGELAFLQRADLVLHAQRQRCVGGARADRLHGAQAPVGHQVLHLAGVPFAVGDRALAAVGAGDDGDPLAMGAGDDGGEVFDLILVGVEDEVGAAEIGAPIKRVRQKREGRNQGGRVAEEHGQVIVRHVRSVDDPVEAGADGIGRRAARAGMDGADLAEAVGDLGDGAQIVEADAAGKLRLAGQHVAVARDLHDIDTVLDLAARLRDHLVPRVAEHGERRFWVLHPRRPGRADRVVGGDVAPGRGHARPLDQAGVNGVANGYRDVPGRAGVGERGNTGAQHLARVVGGAQRPVLHARVEIELLERQDVAVGDMAVAVDHARHDRAAGGVDGPVAAESLGRGRDLPVGADLADAVALHQHRDAVLRRRAGPVEQPPAGDQVSAHVPDLPALPRSSDPRPTGPAGAPGRVWIRPSPSVRSAASCGNRTAGETRA